MMEIKEIESHISKVPDYPKPGILFYDISTLIFNKDAFSSSIKKLTDKISSYLSDNDNFMVNDNYKSFVRLEKFNDSSIDIIVICFTSTKDWEKYLQIREELAMEIKNNVEKIGLNFAFPSQSIYIEKNSSY